MKLRHVAPAAVLALCGATLPSLASSPGARIEFAAAHVVRGDLGAASGAPKEWAARALKAQAGRLGVDAGTFRFETVRTSLIGTHVRGRQYRGGLPIDGTDVLVSAIDGRIAQVDADATTLVGEPAAGPVSQAVARAAALSKVGVTTLMAPTVAKRSLAVVGGALVDAWTISVLAAVPAKAATVVVSAATGKVLEVRDEARYDTGTGYGRALVFDPNPIQHTRNPALREPGVDVMGADTDLNSPALTKARSFVAFKGMDPNALALTTRLIGTWVNVLGMVGYTSVGTGKEIVLDYKRADPQFEGLMAYAHIDRYQRYMQSLGFQGAKGVNREQQEIVTTRVETYDNSFYQPGNDIMVMGTGGVDDAEDAEVILHEYGHAMQDDQVPGFGAKAEGGAMGEGFGDFNAGNYFARTSGGGYYDVCMMEWDSTSYSTSNPTCIRRMDSKKHYPADLEDEVHADGEMWSTFLWNVRSHLPGTAAQKSDAAARLVISSHELETPNAEFANAVAAMRTAARALHHPEYVAFINAEAKKIGFKLNP
jgi:hypothetical protein